MTRVILTNKQTGQELPEAELAPRTEDASWPKRVSEYFAAERMPEDVQALVERAREYLRQRGRMLGLAPDIHTVHADLDAEPVTLDLAWLAAISSALEAAQRPPVSGDDPIPRYAQLDVWMALFGAERSGEYEPFREEHGFAETWAWLCAQVRAQRPPVSPEVREDEWDDELGYVGPSGVHPLDRAQEAVESMLLSIEKGSDHGPRDIAEAALDAARSSVPSQPVGVHWECDCVPDLGPSHCHACSDATGREVPWSEAVHGVPSQQPVSQVSSAEQCAYDPEAHSWSALPHDPFPIKVTNRTTGAHITTLPMTALSSPAHHMAYERHEFAPDEASCQRIDHYLPAPSQPVYDEEKLAEFITRYRFKERGLRGVIGEPDIAVARPLAAALVAALPGLTKEETGG